MSYFIANKKEYIEAGSPEFDFIMVTADAYVDHPSFGSTIICKVLEKNGYSVGVIPQPKWDNLDDFTMFGRPKYAFLVSGGNIDSMVNHYSVSKNRRKQDLYSPGGKIGHRPDRPTIVYSNKIREAYKDIAIIGGGVEGSLRRFSHYDYWDNKIRRSIMMDSALDILVYGMGEKQIVEIAEALESGLAIKDITFIKGTVYKTKDIENVYDYVTLPSFNEVKKDKDKYNESYKLQFANLEFGSAKNVVESYGTVYVVQNIPQQPLTTNEFDSVYNLNYERNYHPMYEKDGGIPAIKEVKFSLISNRGCFGNCNFCALTFHQGRSVQVRSHKSIVMEAEKMVWEEDFKGYIHDVGGPTANFRFPACKKQEVGGVGACINKKCLSPAPCKQLKIDHMDYLKLLRKLRELPRVKKVFVRSGLRYDYLIHDKNNDQFFNELCEHHISGQLKVAPEHVSDKVLEKMGKPSAEVYNKFVRKYKKVNERLGKEQYIVPYLMSSHPGSDLAAAIELAEYLRDLRHTPEQVQDFYPTPATLSTCIYYTEKDPFTGEKVYVPKTKEEKAMQRALIQYRLPQNYELVYKALKKAGRDDLIGFGPEALIRPRNAKPRESYKGKNNKNGKNNKPYENKTNNKKTTRKKTIRNVHKKK